MQFFEPLIRGGSLFVQRYRIINLAQSGPTAAPVSADYERGGFDFGSTGSRFAIGYQLRWLRGRRKKTIKKWPDKNDV